MMKLGGTLLGQLELDPISGSCAFLHAVKLVKRRITGQHVATPAVRLSVANWASQRLTDGRLLDACEKSALRFTRRGLWIDVRASDATLAGRAQAPLESIDRRADPCGRFLHRSQLTETLDVETEAPDGPAPLIRRREAVSPPTRRGP